MGYDILYRIDRRKNKPNQSQFWLCNTAVLATFTWNKTVLICVTCPERSRRNPCQLFCAFSAVKRNLFRFFYYQQYQSCEDDTEDIEGKLQPDEIGADKGGAKQGRSKTLQKRNLPKLKKFQNAGCNKDACGNWQNIFPFRPKEIKKQTPDNLINRTGKIKLNQMPAEAGIITPHIKTQKREKT